MHKQASFNKILSASILMLAVLMVSKPSEDLEISREISSIKEPLTIENQDVEAVENIETKIADHAEAEKESNLSEVRAPAPYFLNSDNFKSYEELLYKVVKNPEQKNKFKMSLLDYRSLEDAASYLKNPSAKPGKDEKIYHLKASGFLIKAITAHPTEFDVTEAIKEVLSVNLSEAKNSMTSEAYTMLKENKAEILYHALAVSEEIQNTYSAASEDNESQNLLKKVQTFHASNTLLSEKMISER